MFQQFTINPLKCEIATYASIPIHEDYICNINLQTKLLQGSTAQHTYGVSLVSFLKSIFKTVYTASVLFLHRIVKGYL